MKNYFAPIVVCLSAVVGYVLPTIFEWVVGVTQTCILGFIMLTMGLTLTAEDFKTLAARPGDIAIGTLAQFSVMPLLAWGVSRLLGLDVSLMLGLVLVGCCPGGVSSNLMSYLCKGDVAFSVGMTTVSTLLAPVATPFLVQVIAGQSVEVDAWGMFRGILIVTVLPISVGFGLNALLAGRESFAKVRDFMPKLSVLALGLIVGGVVSQVRPHLEMGGVALLALTFGAVLCHNSLGYLVGYGVGRLFGFSVAKNRTISLEVGMQNAGLATNLASAFFMAANPLAVVPCAISCAWHSISGTLLATWLGGVDKD